MRRLGRGIVGEYGSGRAGSSAPVFVAHGVDGPVILFPAVLFVATTFRLPLGLVQVEDAATLARSLLLQRVAQLCGQPESPSWRAEALLPAVHETQRFVLFRFILFPPSLQQHRSNWMSERYC